MLLAILAIAASAAYAQPPDEQPAAKTRQIFVPYSELKVILDSGPQRVLLSREQYDELVKKATKTPDKHIPHPAVVVSSDYNMTAEEGRARIRGAVVIDVLDDGLHAVPLDLGGVGLLAATLDDRPAAIGRAADGRLNLLVSGSGQHRLALDMVCPLETTAAEQVLRFRLTNAAVGKWHLTVPGDVEIKGGADVVSRDLDKTANVTRFELLPRGGDSTILMSLNSHLQRRDQAVASRCVVFDEVTAAYERLHATITFWILHRAVDRFSFFVPDGFEITQIESPLLSRWDVATEGGRKVVNVRLREPTSDTVALSVSAIKAPSQLTKWRLPRLELRDVVSQVTLLGLVVQSDLKTESLAAENLIAVDTASLAGALPASLARQEADALPRTFVAAYYAPQAAYELTADFTRPPAALAVTTHMLLSIRDQGCEVQGGFQLTPTTEKRFSIDIDVPAGWNVTAVTGFGGVPLAIERYEPENKPWRVHVKLPQGIAVGQVYPVEFVATRTPAGWMSDWTSQQVEFPMFSVAGAATDEGALAVAVGDGLEVRPDKLQRLVPIVDEEKSRFGLANSSTALAYRYESAGATAALAVDRTQSRATARTFAFFKFSSQRLSVHYEVVYTISDAKTRRLALDLPLSTPDKLSIKGLGGATVKEFTPETVGDARRWNILLGEARRGEVRLAVDFELLPEAFLTPSDKSDFVLPLLKAENVVYQSGVVAVEGGEELDVQVKADAIARRADVGQLAPADYAIGRRLLGAYSFAGDAPKIAVAVARNPAYPLTPAIIERADLKTLLSTDGTSQTQANFLLRTKALYLEVGLPKDATLWSAVLDGAPLKPQKKDGARLLALPPGPAGAARSLQLVYEAPVEAVTRAGRLRLVAPRLLYRAADDPKHPIEIPLVNVQWKVSVPGGYEAVAADGTLEAQGLARPTPAPLVVRDVLLWLGGGYGGPIRGDAAATANSLQGWGVDVQDGAKFSRQSQDRSARVRTQDSVVAWGVTPRDAARPADGPPAGQRFGLAGALEDKKTEAAGLAGRGLDVTIDVTIIGKGTTSPEAPAAPPPPAGPMSGPGTTSSSSDIYLNGYSQNLPSATTSPSSDEKPNASQLSVLSNNGVLSGMSSKPAYRGGKLLGVGSLKIDIQQTGSDTSTVQGVAPVDEQVLTFTSLGANPEIEIALAGRDRVAIDSGDIDVLGLPKSSTAMAGYVLNWGPALLAFLIGVAITCRSVRQKLAFVLVLGLVSAVVPLAWDTVSVARLCNGIFFAASLLVPYYLAAGLVRWIVAKAALACRCCCGNAATTAAVIAALAIACSMPLGAKPQAAAQDPGLSLSGTDSVVVPEDALIVPYDAKAENGVEKADHLLVPYNRYVELWNRANPDKKIEKHPAPLPYALSGATYRATLEGDQTLNVTGRMQIDVFVDGYVSIPMTLRGGVLAQATLDGKPAQMKIVESSPVPPGMSQGGGKETPMDASAQTDASAALTPDASPKGSGELLLLHVVGKGTHKLELEVRLMLTRVGGWRNAAGALPAAPAATVAFRVPQPQTEVRLGQNVDRRTRETARADETIETALGTDGAVQVQWRPKVAEAQVDRDLTVESTGLLDVEEDGLRMAVNLKLQFGRAQRDNFTLTLPADFLVEKVAGGNVRGWEVRRGDKEQTVEISLLKTAKDSEKISLFLGRSGRVGVAPLDKFDVPCVTVRDAALNSGQVMVRRSVLLDVRTVERSGVSRIDFGALPDLTGGPATEESVLTTRPYEAYRFATTPFVLRLAAAPVDADVTAEAQTRIKLATDELGLESRIVFHIGRRKLYRLEVAVPGDLQTPEVVLPAAGQWTIEKRDKRSVLRVNLAQGVEGDAALIVRGKLGTGARGVAKASDAQREVPLPRLDVLGVKRQEGEIAVQADPAFDVATRDLRDCKETDLARVNAWLDAPLRAATRVALRYGGGEPAGWLRLVARKPDVVCDTITNVKVTDRAIEETIVLNYEIRNAGIRELSFLLPAAMRDARISTPLLRRKTVMPVDAKAADSPLLVRLELQNDAMNDLRVLVQNDRLLPSGSNSYSVPLPAFEGAAADFVRRQYVVLESTNRDEIVVEPLKGLEPIGRQQLQWQALCSLMGTNNLYKAYEMTPGADAPRLSFHLQAHEELQTAGARIDLARTTMVVDANGAYRAKLELTLDNSAEQFLDVELPQGAELWTVHVAGKPVKPVKAPGAPDDRRVLLPVVKTAKGDVGYQVVLQYGGKLPPLSSLSPVQFPLIHTVKSYPRGASIGIERSQLVLYVPRSHHWYDFGSQMHVTDQAEQQAGEVSVLNLQGQRLLEAANDKDPYTRLRARGNLKVWASQSAKVQGDAAAAGNQSLRREVAANSGALVQAKDLLSQSNAVQPQHDEQATDNRERLNELYSKQVVKNATGTLNLGGANTYSGGTTISGGTLQVQNDAEFNAKWIDRNKLSGQSDTAGTVGVNGGVLDLKGQSASISGLGSQSVAQAATQPNQDAFFGRDQKSAGQQPGLTKSGNGALIVGDVAAVVENGDQQQRELAQYQQKIDAGMTVTNGSSVGIGRTTATILAGSGPLPQQAGQAQAGLKPGEGRNDSFKRFSDDIHIAGGAVDLVDGRMVVTAAEPAMPAAPTGLASLDFQLPTDGLLYQSYYFTTPRSEAELTARTISGETLTRLLSLAGVAAAALLLWVGIRLIDRGALSWLRHPLGAALLLVAGIVLLCAGFLPVVALIAMIAGVWYLVVWLVTRRRQATAVS